MIRVKFNGYNFSDNTCKVCHKPLPGGCIGTCGDPQCIRDLMAGRAAPALTADPEKVYELPIESAAWLTEKLDALAKRGKKLSVPCTATLEQVGEVRSVWDYIGPGNRDLCVAADRCRGGECPVHWREVLLADYRLIGSLPVLPDGWSLLAALDFDPVLGCIVREAPGQTCPAKFRTDATPHCDHCSHKRARKTCYVLRAKDGREVQVGSTCIGDYIRSTDVESTIEALLRVQGAWASFWERIRSGELDPDTFGRSHREHGALLTLLSHVSATVRVNKGIYVTRKMADAANEAGRPCHSTALIAERTMEATTSKEKAMWPDQRTAADVVEATAAIEWARSLEGGTSFDQNLRTFATASAFRWRDVGTAAYIVEAYRKATHQRPTFTRPAAPPRLIAADGERITVDVEVIRKAYYDSELYGRTYITVMRKLPLGTVTGDAPVAAADDGAVLVWKSREVPMVRSIRPWELDGPTCERQQGHRVPADVGDRLHLSCKVKVHEVRKNEEQTIVTHVTTLCDGWGFSTAHEGEDNVLAYAKAKIAAGDNKPPVKVKAARKPRKRAAEVQA